MIKMYGCEAKLVDPYLIEQFSSGTIGDLKMWDYYSSKSQFDNYFHDALFYPMQGNEYYYRLLQLEEPVVNPFYYKGREKVLSYLLDLSSQTIEDLIYRNKFYLVNGKEEDLCPWLDIPIVSYYELTRLKEQGRNPISVTGGQAIKTLLEEIDWFALIESLKNERLKCATSVAERIQKRIDIIESFISSGVRPQWIVFDKLPIPQVDLLFSFVPYSTKKEIEKLYLNVAFRNERLKHIHEYMMPDAYVKSEGLELQVAIEALYNNSGSFDSFKKSSAYYGSYITYHEPWFEYPISEFGSPLHSLSDMLKSKASSINKKMIAHIMGYSLCTNKDESSDFCDRLASGYTCVYDYEWEKIEKQLNDAVVVEEYEDEYDNFEPENIELDDVFENLVDEPLNIYLTNIRTDDTASLYLTLFFLENQSYSLYAEEIKIDGTSIKNPTVRIDRDNEEMRSCEIFLSDGYIDPYFDISFNLCIYVGNELIRKTEIEIEVDLVQKTVRTNSNLVFKKKEPARASLRMLLAFPDDYYGNEIMIEETLSVLKNDVSRKVLTVAQFSGFVDYDNTIEIFYERLSDVRRFIMLTANKQKIQVTGTVCKYNSPWLTKPCIMATQIIEK